MPEAIFPQLVVVVVGTNCVTSNCGAVTLEGLLGPQALSGC